MEQKIKTIKIIHLAIVSGVILAYFFTGDFKQLTDFKFPEINSQNVIYLLLPLFAIFISNYLFRMQISKITQNDDVNAKFALYQTASLIRWAVIEAVAFIILFLKPEFTIFGILLIVYLLLIHPTEDKIKTELHI